MLKMNWWPDSNNGNNEEGQPFYLHRTGGVTRPQTHAGNRAGRCSGHRPYRKTAHGKLKASVTMGTTRPVLPFPKRQPSSRRKG